MIKAVTALAGVLCLSVSSFGEFRYVVTNNPSAAPPFTNWTMAAMSIQDAVSQCADGDTVFVSNGTYVLASEIVISNAITVKSFSGRDATTVNGNSAVRCFMIRNGSAIVDGFTILNGVGSYGDLSDPMFVYIAGGIYMAGGTVKNCRVISNSYYSAVSANSAAAGGIYCKSNGVIEDCLISHNFVGTRGGGMGAGVYITTGAVRRCTISDNQISCRLASNGGGIYSAGGAVIEQCLVLRNRADAGGAAGCGGGIYAAPAQILNCAIMDNYAGLAGNNYGGGVYLSGSFIGNCTIVRNRADGPGSAGSYGYGGGLYFAAGAVQNTLIADNFAGVDGTNCYGAGTNYSFCCSVPLLSNGIGNTDGDPQLRGEDPLYYRFRGGSSCIDAGTNADWLIGGQDIEGQSRIHNGTVDIGCYEETNVVVANAVCSEGSVDTLWYTGTGIVCSLQYSTNAMGPDWYDTGSMVTTASARVSMPDTSAPQPPRYYRLLWTRP